MQLSDVRKELIVFISGKKNNSATIGMTAISDLMPNVNSSFTVVKPLFSTSEPSFTATQLKSIMNYPGCQLHELFFFFTFFGF